MVLINSIVVLIVIMTIGLGINVVTYGKFLGDQTSLKFSEVFMDVIFDYRSSNIRIILRELVYLIKIILVLSTWLFLQIMSGAIWRVIFYKKTI